MLLRLVFLVALTLLVGGCAGKNVVNDLRVSLGIDSAYDVAVDEFKQGLVMEARSRLVSIKKEHKDYTQAQSFLKKKVEPARLKLLRYYARKGKKEEGLEHWAKAEDAYKSAAGLSTKPKALLTYQENMNLKVRQLRADEIYAQRQQEDDEWLKWQSEYNPPKGLMGDDESFAIAREDLNESLDKRLDQARSLAEKFRKMKLPELAWVYADSFLRFKPDVKKVQDLKLAMASDVPKDFRLGQISKKVTKRSVSKPQKASRSNVTKASVEGLMIQGKWLEAREEAQALRRAGDASADALLEDIQANIADLAAKAYSEGNLAFRLEQIDKAVDYWQQAVTYMPSEMIYVESLRRGIQIQERLSALKTEESQSEKDTKIEE